MCFGLRVDFRGELFPGSATLLALADEMREVRTICHCGKKATMVVRLDADGNALPFVINGTMMRIDLPAPLASKGATTFHVAWNYQMNDADEVGARTAADRQSIGRASRPFSGGRPRPSV